MNKFFKTAMSVIAAAGMLLQTAVFAEDDITPAEKAEIKILASDGGTELSSEAVYGLMLNQNTFSYLTCDSSTAAGGKTRALTTNFSTKLDTSKMTTQTPTTLHRIMTNKVNKEGTKIPLPFKSELTDFENNVIRLKIAAGANFKKINTDADGKKIVKLGLAHTDWSKEWSSSGKTEVKYVNLNNYIDLDSIYNATEINNKNCTFYDVEIPVKDIIESDDFTAVNGSDGTELSVDDINTVVWAIDFPIDIQSGTGKSSTPIIFFNDMYFAYAPQSVSGLTAQETSDTVKLSWDEAESEGVSYNIFRDGTYIASTDETEFTDTELTPATEYEYGVQTQLGSSASAAESVCVITKDYFEDPALLDAGFKDIEVNGNGLLGDVTLETGTTAISGRLVSDSYTGSAVAAAVFVKDGVMKDVAIDVIDEVGASGSFELSLNTEKDGEVRFFALDSLSGLKLISQAGVINSKGFFEKKIARAEPIEDFKAEFDSFDSGFKLSNKTEGASVVLAAAKGTDLKSITPENADEKIAYIYVSESSATAEEPLKIIFDDTRFEDGTYSFYSQTAGNVFSGEAYYEEFASTETISNIYIDLNKADVTDAEIQRCIETPILKLDLTDYNRVSKASAVRQFAQLKPQQINGVADIESTLNSAVGTVLFCSAVKKSNSDVIKYAEILGLDNSLTDWLISLPEGSEVNKYTYEIMAKRSAGEMTFENARQIFKECCICALASDSSNTWKKLSEVLKTYNLVDLSLISSNGLDEADVFKGMLNTNYQIPGDISSKYTSVINSLKNPKKGGGGGGGGSSTTSSPAVYIPSEKPSIDANAPSYDEGSFADLPKSHWAYENVEALANRNIISRDRNFRPSDGVKREEFVKMLVMCVEPATDKTCEFDDVSSDDWFYPYVNAAISSGLVNGVTQNHFGAGENILRQDIAVMLYRATGAKSAGSADDKTLFNDSEDISDYAKEAVAYLNSVGIINGDENGNVNPRSYASRAECAKMICSFLEFINAGA